MSTVVNYVCKLFNYLILKAIRTSKNQLIIVMYIVISKNNIFTSKHLAVQNDKLRKNVPNCRQCKTNEKCRVQKESVLKGKKTHQQCKQFRQFQAIINHRKKGFRREV